MNVLSSVGLRLYLLWCGSIYSRVYIALNSAAHVVIVVVVFAPLQFLATCLSPS